MIGSRYLREVVCTVAAVPKLRLTLDGSTQPTPSVSHPLSEPAAMIGIPSGIPVSLAAREDIVPIRSPGSVSSGTWSRRTLNMCHRQLLSLRGQPRPR